MRRSSGSLLLCFATGCASDPGSLPSSNSRSGSATETQSPSGTSDDPSAFIADDGCGDGALNDTELCDDANTRSGDGCSADCLNVEAGFACPTPSAACLATARCGDGLVSPPEQCDDGKQENGDGCSERCRLEPGNKCEGNPSSCSKTECGDAIRVGTEGCDDGNREPLDGCSAECAAEPSCDETGCSSACGDALTVNEECDDGNNADGDGCSAACVVEVGASCKAIQTEQAEMRVPIVYRDFKTRHDPGGHPDFDFDGLIPAPGKVVPGIVKTALGTNGKPELTDQPPVDAKVSTPANFAKWYSASPEAKEFLDELVLTRNGQAFSFSEKAFFPLDSRGWAILGEPPREAYIPPNWLPGGPHYFFFTSELTHWFRYDPAAAASLTFTGDDDVWVFVNRRLVVDLGGIHSPQSASFILNDSLSDTDGVPLALKPGTVYEIALFQAERNPGGSSYELELSGFDASPSECTSACGDGTVSPGLEECDDGNPQSGDGCSSNCTWEVGIRPAK